MWVGDELQELADRTFWGLPGTIEQLHGTLRANLHLPPDHNPDNKYPAVLLLHGLGGNRAEHNGLFIKAAATLAQSGWVALRIDFRGSGETGGSTLDMSIETQVQDANDALDHLLQIPHIDRHRLAVLGLSFGGLTAACLAAKRTDVNALVLWEAVYDMKCTLKRLYGPLSLKAVRTRGYMQAGMMQLSATFFDTLDKLDAEKKAASYKGPVLIVQGIADTVVPVETAYEWKRHFVNTETDIHLIEEADHAFTRESWASEAIATTVSWLNARIKT